jgi:leader peptidase (prepilin peptidase)/N-methyltransferase
MDQGIFTAIIFVFGLMIGSFLNVVIWRLPREQKLTGRSHCPHCDHVLTAAELVPLFSFVWQRGRCAHCRAPISIRYPLIELSCGLLFLVAVLLFPPAVTVDYVLLLRILIAIAVLIPVFVIDLEHYIILDVIILPASLVMLGLNVVSDLLLSQSLIAWSSYTIGGIVAALAAGAFFYVIWKVSSGRWMGFGDVKLTLLLGLILGLPGIVTGLFMAFLLGSVVGIGLMALRIKKLKSMLPFGTFLSVATILALFFGPQLWYWYLQLIGWR